MEDRNREVEMKKSMSVCVILVLLFMVSFANYSQSSPGAPAKDERTVEESYLEETLEALVIREQAQAESLKMKEEAIKSIREAFKEGRKNEDIYKALDYLALEGIVRITRTAGVGKPTNNFPKIRSDACGLLGEMQTEAAKDTLVKVVYADDEPMVIASAVRALGTMGKLINEEATQAIVYMANRYDILAPDSTLAFETLVAFERIAEANGGIKDPAIIRTILKIADGNYAKDARDKADEVLKTLRSNAYKK
jgi:HEAT repeat protein